MNSAARWKDVLRGTMDEASSLWLLCRSRARPGRASDWAASFSDPIMGGPSGSSRKEKRGPARNITPASDAEAEKRLTSTGRIEKSQSWMPKGSRNRNTILHACDPSLGQIINRIALEGSPVAACMAAEYAVTCAV